MKPHPHRATARLDTPILTAPAPTDNSTPSAEDQAVKSIPSVEDQAATSTPSGKGQPVTSTPSVEDQPVTSSVDQQAASTTAGIVQAASGGITQQSGSLAGSSTATGSTISSSSGTNRTVSSGQEDDGSSSLPAESKDTQSTVSPADEAAPVAANSSGASNGGPVATALMPPAGVQSGVSTGAMAMAPVTGSGSRSLAGQKAPGAETGVLLPVAGDAEQASSAGIRSEQPAEIHAAAADSGVEVAPRVPRARAGHSLTTRARWRPRP